MSTAPPRAYAALPNKNNGMEWPTEPISLPTKKMAMANSSNGFLAQMSDTLPHEGTKTILARMYELTIHVCP